ncbi:hypothetical protein SeLEV6574_g02312, partial [Synchytrium endobioticum]
MDSTSSPTTLDWNWQNLTIAALSLASLSLALSYYSATSSLSTSSTGNSRNRNSKKVNRRNQRPRNASNVSYEGSPSRNHSVFSNTRVNSGVSSTLPDVPISASAESALRAVDDAGPQDKASDESKNLLNLLYSIAEDQARKDGFVHRSITCNHCGTSPIRGFRYKCANCLDYDLCESCEAQEVHPKTHVFLKIRIPIPPLANPRTALLTPFYPGKEGVPPSLPWDELRSLQRKTHFDQVELEAFYEQFKSLSTASEGGITKETFDTCLGPLGVEKNLVTERIFCFFDQNSDGIISFPELVCGLSILCKGSLDERIKHAFNGYDLDGDGFISRSELHRMFKAYFHLSMELVRDVVKTMEEGMMESFDDEAAKPVSAAFAAPIPSSGAAHDDDSDESGKQKVEPSSSSCTASSNRGHNSGSTNAATTTTTSNSSTLYSTQTSHTSTTHVEGSGPVRNNTQDSLASPMPTSSSSNQLPQSSSQLRKRGSNNALSLSATTSNPNNGTVLSSPTQQLSDADRRFMSSSPQPLDIPNSRRRNVLMSGLITDHLPTPVVDPSLYTPSAFTPLYTPAPLSATGLSYRSPEPDRLVHFGNNSNSSSAHYNAHGHSQQHNVSASEHWPVMEAMSQDAIEEMVERTFATAGLSSEEKMGYNHFQ